MNGYAQRKSGLFVPENYSPTFEAARPSRHRAWRPTVTQDSNLVITPWVRTVLMSHSRHLYANKGVVGGAINDTACYMAGEDGIQPEPLTDDPAWNAEVKARWTEWAKIADLTRRLHLNEIVELSSTQADVDGDFFVLLTETGGGDTELGGMAQLQCLRGHRIGESLSSRSSDGQTNDGVREDKNGRAVSFRVLDASGEFERDIPARSMVHLVPREYPDQTRGIPAIARGINPMTDIEDVVSFEMAAQKDNARRAVVIKTATGEVDEDDAMSDEEAEEHGYAGLTLEELQGGEILRLGPGEELQELTNVRPGPNFLPFVEFRYRDFACGYGMPLEFIYKSDLGGPAQRFFLSKAQRRIRKRTRLVIMKMMLRIYGYWICKEMKRGAIPWRDDWYKVLFVATSPGITIDVGREAQQNREDLLFGNRSLQEDAAERGRDWRELRAQTELEARDLIERAQRLAKDTGIEFQLALSLLSRRGSSTSYLNMTEIIAPKDKQGGSARPVSE